MRRFGRRRFRYERRPPWGRPGFAGRARRGRGPLVPGRALNPKLQRELRRANQLLAKGEHINAARIFESLALRARDLDLLFPAPMLFMQAAHAYLLGEDLERAEENAQLALGLLAEQERWKALQREGERYVRALDAAGQPEQAQTVSAWLSETLKDKSLERPAESSEAKSTLPEKCPYCGASMSLEQINARGGKAAECQFCGSVVLPRDQE